MIRVIAISFVILRQRVIERTGSLVQPGSFSIAIMREISMQLLINKHTKGSYHTRKKGEVKLVR
ncbi:hypothetical protein [Thalassobacillus devorans]|uniref:hypothetical protein n=1 Tax=Thalassobacillus devorans TaxID=279813 RepID=UPI000A1CCFC7|nr:hypothetical protein [Thalassobacillus devorans]